MTAIVGVRCKDGVVIGSDSSTTFTVGQHRTIEQKGKKVFIVRNDVIVSGSGQVGLCQRFVDIVDKARKEADFKSIDAIEIGRVLTGKALQNFGSTQAPKGQFGALVAFPSNSGLELCEFAMLDFQPELKTDHLWYVSMGSGQPITDPFLGLMRRVFWKDSPPTMKQGLFAVTWALQHAIELNPGGINGPIQIAILCRESGKGKATAKLIENEELAEHINNVEGAEDYLSKYPSRVECDAAKDIPEPPTSSMSEKDA